MAQKPATIVGIKHNIDCNDQPIEILALGDLHIGDRYADLQLIRSLVDSVRYNGNRYVILTGDLMNTAIAGGKSDVYADTMNPQEQLDYCVDLLSPIRNKILTIVAGNHEERIARSTGIDTTKELAARLDLENVYRATSALLLLRFGRDFRSGDPITYSMYINHGHGGGRRPGGKLNSLQDYALVIDADCYVVGHTHLPASFKTSTFRISPQRARAVMREQLFVNTASAISYGGYGDRGGYQPASNSYPVITFDNSHKHMTVTL